MNEAEIQRARRETRGIKTCIHFNNAGSSLISAPVADYLYGFLREEEIKGGYETAALREMELENFYIRVAELINARPEEIAFVENATRAWDMIFYSIPLKAGDQIITVRSEYGSNVIAYLHRAKLAGAELVIVENNEHGEPDTNQLKKLINEKTKLISISHIPTGGGLVNPAKKIGEIANEYEIPFLLDACQSVGQMLVDVNEIGCDFLSATGRKFLRGPRGTGFLYVKQNWIERLDPPLIDQFAANLIDEKTYLLRRDARKFENWERYFAGQATLGKAIEYAMDFGVSKIQKRIFKIADTLRKELRDISEVEITDQGLVQCGIVTFRHAKINAKVIKSELARKQINVSVSSGSGSRLSFMERGIDSVVRASLHYYNTEEELEYFLSELKQLAS